MKKKIFLFIIILCCCLSIGFVSFKAKAYSPYLQVNVDTTDCLVYFQTPLGYTTGNFIREANETISIAEYTNDSDFFILNNNSNYLLKKGALYCVLFENTINHFIFYSIELPNNINNLDPNNVIVTELFTIPLTTNTISYFDIYSQSFLLRVDINNPSTTLIGQAFYYRFFDQYLYDYAVLQRNNGYTAGYNNGYSTGYSEGQAGKTVLNKVWDLLSGLFGTVGTIMSIELFPNVPIGLFIFVPLFFATVGLILWIWRRN